MRKILSHPIAVLVFYLLLVVIFSLIIITYSLNASFMMLFIIITLAISIIYTRTVYGLATFIFFSGCLWVLIQTKNLSQLTLEPAIYASLITFISAEIFHRLSEEKKRSEFSLRKCQEHYEHLVKNSPTGIVLINPEGIIVEINPVFYKIFSALDKNLLGENIYNLPTFQNIGIIDDFISVLKDNISINKEKRIEYKPSYILDISYHMTTARDAKSSILGVLVTLENITEKNNAIRALRQSEGKYRLLIEEINQAIFSIDLEGRITYISPVITQIIGYLPEEITGKCLINFIHNDEQGRFNHIFRQATKGIRNTQQFRIIGKNSLTQHVQIYFQSFTQDSESGFILGSITDITDRVNSEVVLTNTQKMVDLGTLVAGVAHEIRSPLQIILGLSERLKKQTDEGSISPPSFSSHLENIHRNAERIDNITRSLLNYTRAAENAMENQNLNAIIKETLLIIEHQLRSWSKINVVTQLEKNLPDFFCDANKIMQTLINLLINARDAMPDGGEIIIKTSSLPESNQIKLEISDNGMGIPDSIQNKIFEKFFTTKPLGLGTGLGLSIVKEIVLAHEGTIDFSSKINQGTTFIITFPTDKSNLISQNLS